MRHRSGRTFGMATGLDNDHGLRPGCGTHPAHESTGILHTLDVEDDALRLRVRREVVKDVTEAEVCSDTGGHNSREGNVAVLGPVKDRRAQGTRLRYQGDAALGGVVVAERGVQPDARTDQAKAVRSEKPDPVRAGEIDDLALKRPAAPADLAESGREDDHRLDPVLAAVLDDGRDRGGGRRHDCQVDLPVDRLEIGIRPVTLDLVMLRIDRVDLPLESPTQQVLVDDLADGIGTVARTEHHDGFRGEKGFQIVRAHGRSIS